MVAAFPIDPRTSVAISPSSTIAELNRRIPYPTAKRALSTDHDGTEDDIYLKPTSSNHVPKHLSRKKTQQPEPNTRDPVLHTRVPGPNDGSPEPGNTTHIHESWDPGDIATVIFGIISSILGLLTLWAMFRLGHASVKKDRNGRHELIPPNHESLADSVVDAILSGGKDERSMNVVGVSVVINDIYWRRNIKNVRELTCDE